jgi:hypothetical protein
VSKYPTLFAVVLLMPILFVIASRFGIFQNKGSDTGYIEKRGYGYVYRCQSKVSVSKEKYDLCSQYIGKISSYLQSEAEIIHGLEGQVVIKGQFLTGRWFVYYPTKSGYQFDVFSQKATH